MALLTKQTVEEDRRRTFKVVILYSILSTNWTPDDTMVSEEAVRRMQHSLGAVGVEAAPATIYKRDVAGALKSFDPREYVVFNWCEGLDDDPNDYGAVTRVLDELGFAYTGADARALLLSQNKEETKAFLLRDKIPTPVSRLYDRAVLNGWRRYPALVKPAHEHCSFGITREAVVDSPQQLKERVQYVLDTWKCPALVEDFIDGVEYNVGVWGDDDLSVLPIGAIDYSIFQDYHDRLCSFDAKWNPDSEAYRLTGVRCPAEIDPALKRRIERAAVKTYKAIGLRDYGRIDMRVRNGVPYVLDVNANPDITMEGGFARSGRAAGYDYGQLIARILGFAAQRMQVPVSVR